MIRLTDIRKVYQLGPVTLEILRGVSLEVRPGDLISIVGPSGCGKSTLLNIVGLLDRPTSGSYILENREAAEMSDDEASRTRNANIGFVFQSFHLLPRLTALQNVGLPLVYRGVSSGRIKRRALEELERVGMADRSDHRPTQLSGGQQQRVAVARALIGQPMVILADEPTGALDPDTSLEIMDMFERLCANHAMAIVIVTHSPEVSRRCHRNYRMDAGILYEDEPLGASAPAPAESVPASGESVPAT